MAPDERPWWERIVQDHFGPTLLRPPLIVRHTLRVCLLHNTPNPSRSCHPLHVRTTEIKLSLLTAYYIDTSAEAVPTVACFLYSVILRTFCAAFGRAGYKGTGI